VDFGGYVLCAVVRKAGESGVWSLDANAVAPRRSTERMFQVLPAEAAKNGINETEYECSVPGDANVTGPLAVAVPGFMAGVGTLWERWGNLRWPEIVAPSQRLVSDGFPYGPTAAAMARHMAVLRRFEPTVRHLMPRGTLPAPTDIWHRPDLETTLERLSAHGWQDFYSGEIGRRVGRSVTEIGGILDAEDMAGYAPRVEPAYETRYRGHAVFAPRLPNGALSALQLLNFLDCFPASVELDSPGYWHRLAEVMKLAWQDRLRYFADPSFTKVPVPRLLSKEYALGRTEALRQFPAALGPQQPPLAAAPPSTVHVSAADHQGNVVAATISQGFAFGSCVTVPGTGIILGHGMARLDPRPGRANSVAPGKRPLNNLSPLIFLLPDRDVALGLRGGRPIINVCAQLAHRIVDGGLRPAETLPAPRLSVYDREPLTFMKFDFNSSVPENILGELAAMGHRIARYQETVEGAGAAHCAEFLKNRHQVRLSGDTWAAGVNA
jgi:gamma-glutamyltranspeptidase / glutathione hydrolase